VIRVLVVDGHPVVREGLKHLIARERDLRVDGEAGTAAATLEIVRRRRVDLVICELGRAGRGGVDVIRELKRLRPELPVLVLSAHLEDNYAVRAVRAGASGYLTKEADPRELVRAIRAVARGEEFFSASLAGRLSRGARAALDTPLHGRLSDREHQVLCLIGSGRTATAIARELELSVKTVATYRARILEKLGMHNNAELTRYALEVDLVG
jgi:DNA-binding NarL/FixJ family response regulator